MFSSQPALFCRQCSAGRFGSKLAETNRAVALLQTRLLETVPVLPVLAATVTWKSAQLSRDQTLCSCRTMGLRSTSVALSRESRSFTQAMQISRVLQSFELVAAHKCAEPCQFADSSVFLWTEHDSSRIQLLALGTLCGRPVALRLQVFQLRQIHRDAHATELGLAWRGKRQLVLLCVCLTQLFCACSGSFGASRLTRWTTGASSGEAARLSRMARFR
jgi:hypothetical protein